MIDDDTVKQLLRINDGLMDLCKWLNERRDIETSSRLIPWWTRPGRSGQEQTALSPARGFVRA
jgi:hypothetical protein